MGLVNKIKKAWNVLVEPEKEESIDTLLIEQGTELRVIQKKYYDLIERECRVIRYNPDKRQQASAKIRLKNAYYGLKVSKESYEHLDEIKSAYELSVAMQELNGILGEIEGLERKKVRVPSRRINKRVAKMKAEMENAENGGQYLVSIDDVVSDSVVKDLVDGVAIDAVLQGDMDNWGGTVTSNIEKPINISSDENLENVVPLDDEVVFGKKNTTEKTTKVNILQSKAEDDYMDDLR